MKQSKIMLAFIATLLITWCVMGLIGYLISDCSYRECIIHGGTLMCMMLFGWVPAVIVAADLDKTLE